MKVVPYLSKRNVPIYFPQIHVFSKTARWPKMKYHLVQKTELMVFDIPLPKSGSDQIPLSYALKSYFQIRVI